MFDIDDVVQVIGNSHTPYHYAPLGSVGRVESTNDIRDSASVVFDPPVRSTESGREVQQQYINFKDLALHEDEDLPLGKSKHE